jgi:predicted AlkP superfamily pyrophosphatase or phosphodiesterase
MPRVALLNVVGLTESLLGAATPRLNQLIASGSKAVIEPVVPAVTCTAQSTYLTGLPPSGHGVVANGWYHRELAEVQFWKQSNHLVAGRKVWEDLRPRVPGFTCAKLFWWYNMYSTADYSITPRPMYPADGRKVFDIHSHPSSIRPAIKRDLGEFPFATFWGPAAGIASPQGGPAAASEWIAASARWIEERHSPTLNLIYLPHLDYNLQRLGPNDPRIPDDVRAIDTIVGNLVDFFHARSIRTIVLSEYGITAVDTAIHLNRVLRQQGWLAVKEELGRELLDAGASRAFAVADHQIAHIYLNDPTIESGVRDVVAQQRGVAAVLGAAEKRTAGLDHPRAGDLVALARENAWFTYYYWLDDALAPDFARCVDIHRKPGYDPVELFIDPALGMPRLKIAWRLLKKKMGFRMLMDVIPLDATLVKGSHGVKPSREAEFPIVIADRPGLLDTKRMAATAVRGLIERSVLDG